LPQERGSARVFSTALANAAPSMPMPSSISTTKRCSGPLPKTRDVPPTTVTVPAPFSTYVSAPGAGAVSLGAASPSARPSDAVGRPSAEASGTAARVVGGSAATAVLVTARPGGPAVPLTARSPRVIKVATVSRGTA
jgi:hypothetical protein